MSDAVEDICAELVYIDTEGVVMSSVTVSETTQSIPGHLNPTRYPCVSK